MKLPVLIAALLCGCTSDHDADRDVATTRLATSSTPPEAPSAAPVIEATSPATTARPPEEEHYDLPDVVGPPVNAPNEPSELPGDFVERAPPPLPTEVDIARYAPRPSGDVTVRRQEAYLRAWEELEAKGALSGSDEEKEAALSELKRTLMEETP